MKSITILPLAGCRRSKKLLKYLQDNQITFNQIDLESAEGKALMEKHHFLASPGFLVDGVSINPYDVLIPDKCQVDEKNFKKIVGFEQQG